MVCVPWIQYSVVLDEDHQSHRKEDLQSYLTNHKILKFDDANHEEYFSDEKGPWNYEESPSLDPKVLDVSISEKRPKVFLELFLVPYSHFSVKNYHE